MSAKGLGTVTHKSLPYFALRVVIILVGFLLSLCLRAALYAATPPESNGFWSDFAHGSLTILTFLPLLLATALGGRLIRRLWTVVPRREAVD